MATGPQGAAVTESEMHSVLDKLTTSLVNFEPAGAVDCFAEDGELCVPDGTFVGRDSIRAYYDWTLGSMKSLAFEPRGIGRAVHPPFVFVEGSQTVTRKDGSRYVTPYLTFAEFDDSGKIRRLVRSFDRWLLATQAAEQMRGPTGPIFRWFVHQVDSGMSKDLPTPASTPE
jgi:ketosteroid isomerase-like protein